MKVFKTTAISTIAAGLAVLAFAFAPSVYGQDRSRGRELTILAGRGGQLGVRIVDAPNGVEIEDVQADSAADKAGLKRGDVILEFDGERVRSSRQFARLVQETPAGRNVKATITREGKRQDVELTLSEGRDSRVILGDSGRFFDRDFREGFRGFAERLPELERGLRDLPNFNYRFELPGSLSGGRLGVTVEELTSQLANYFGAKDGVLVTSVTDGSPAAKAGIKAGDVITSVNGDRVTSSADLIQSLRRASDRGTGPADGEVDVTIGIVRDKKEQTVKAKIEAPRRSRAARPA